MTNSYISNMYQTVIQSRKSQDNGTKVSGVGGTTGRIDGLGTV